MTPDQFIDALRADGFLDVEQRIVPSGTLNPEHRHAWDAWLLVVEGGLLLDTAQGSRRYGPGETFQVAREVPHSEHYETETRLVVGRRH